MFQGRCAGLAAIVLLALAIVLSSPAGGEHTPRHRYFVTGTVTNTSGEPMCGIVVRAADVTPPPNEDGSDNRTATTDGQGRYTIQLHMHDGTLGEDGRPLPNEVGHTIRVSIDSAAISKDVAANVNPDNPVGWGQQPADFELSTTSRGSCPDLVVWAGLGAGVAGAVVVAVWFVRKPRRVGRGSRAQLRQVTGVGRARARELESMGIKSVTDLAEADPRDLSRDSTLTPKQARLLVKRASEVTKGEKA